MRRAILVTIALIALLAVVFYVDFTTLWEALAGLSVITIVLLLVLLTLGSLTKALRWAFYLRAARLDISWRDGMTSYLAGMSVAAVPGGSILPARLAQEHGDVRMRQAAAALFVAFIGDMLALAILATIAITVVDAPNNRYLIPATALVLAGTLIAMGRSERIWHAVDRTLIRWRLTRDWLPKEADIHEKVAMVSRAPVIARGTLFSTATTIMSIAILYLLVNGLTFRGISVIEAWYVHAFSESAATVIPSPGGIGVIDSSMLGLLNSLSIGWIRATFVVLSIRSFDLLFKTAVGSVVLVVFYHDLLLSMLQFRRRVRRARFQARRVWRFSRNIIPGPGLISTVTLRMPRLHRAHPVSATAIEQSSLTEPPGTVIREPAPPVDHGISD